MPPKLPPGMGYRPRIMQPRPDQRPAAPQTVVPVPVPTPAPPPPPVVVVVPVPVPAVPEEEKNG